MQTENGLLKWVPEQDACCDDLHIAHDLICGCININQSSKLNVVVN